MEIKQAVWKLEMWWNIRDINFSKVENKMNLVTKNKSNGETDNEDYEK